MAAVGMEDVADAELGEEVEVRRGGGHALSGQHRSAAHLDERLRQVRVVAEAVPDQQRDAGCGNVLVALAELVAEPVSRLRHDVRREDVAEFAAPVISLAAFEVDRLQLRLSMPVLHAAAVAGVDAPLRRRSRGLSVYGERDDTSESEREQRSA